MKLKVIETTKPYSWLEYEINLIGCSKPLHLTVKFFGQAEIDPSFIQAALEHFPKLSGRVPNLHWKPEIFSGLTHVLEITNAPKELELMHNFFGLIKDQFQPWRPHITVPHEYWNTVQMRNLKPDGERLSFGELRLFVGTLS